MTFKQALKTMPSCVNGFDPMTHTRIEDLAWLTQHELDLYLEGEDSDIRNQKDLGKAKAFYQLLTGKEYRYQE